jgi:hypothetical protein
MGGTVVKRGGLNSCVWGEGRVASCFEIGNEHRRSFQCMEISCHLLLKTILLPEAYDYANL